MLFRGQLINPFGNVARAHYWRCIVVKNIFSVLKAKKARDLGCKRIAAVGYPKTGNTWTRIMLGHYIQSLYQLQEIPLFEDSVQDEQDIIYEKSSLDVFFTHSPLMWVNQVADDLTYNNVIQPYQQKKVVLLVRHPLDTLVSSFMHSKYKITDNPYKGNLIQFINDPVMGLDKYFRFYQLWNDHKSDVADILIWKYEDLKTKPIEHLLRLIAYIGEPVLNNYITDAIKYSEFDNLKNIEKAGRNFTYPSSGFDVFGETDHSKPETFHVRRGVVGGYKDYIDISDLRYLEGRIKHEMPPLYKY